MHPHLPQGIRVEESTKQKQAIQGVENRPTAFVGACERGPLNSPTLVHSFGEFLQVFGSSGSDHPLPHAIQLFFANGGQNALVVRVANNARPAYIDLPGEGGPLRLKSLRKGAYEYLRAAVDYDGVDSVDADCFNLTLQRLAAPRHRTRCRSGNIQICQHCGRSPQFYRSRAGRFAAYALARCTAIETECYAKSQYWKGSVFSGVDRKRPSG